MVELFDTPDGLSVTRAQLYSNGRLNIYAASVENLSASIVTFQALLSKASGHVVTITEVVCCNLVASSRLDGPVDVQLVHKKLPQTELLLPRLTALRIRFTDSGATVMLFPSGAFNVVGATSLEQVSAAVALTKKLVNPFVVQVPASSRTDAAAPTATAAAK
jgi:hypothetical protein